MQDLVEMLEGTERVDGYILICLQDLSNNLP